MSSSPRTLYNSLYVSVASSAEKPASVNPVSSFAMFVRASRVLSVRPRNAPTAATQAPATATIAPAAALPMPPMASRLLPASLLSSPRSSTSSAASELSSPSSSSASVCFSSSALFLFKAAVSLLIFVRSSTACLLVGSNPFFIRFMYSSPNASTFACWSCVTFVRDEIFALSPSWLLLQSSIPAAAALNSLSLSRIMRLACVSPALSAVMSIEKDAPRVSLFGIVITYHQPPVAVLSFTRILFSFLLTFLFCADATVASLFAAFIRK